MSLWYSRKLFGVKVRTYTFQNYYLIRAIAILMGLFGVVSAGKPFLVLSVGDVFGMLALLLDGVIP